MTNSSTGRAHTAEPLRRAASLLLVSPIAAFLLYTVWVALASAVWNDDFPESLAVKVELLPLIFPLHMVPGGRALTLVAAAFRVRLDRRCKPPVGRIAAPDVLIAGVTAYPVAWVAPVTFWSAMGFSAQATAWLALLAAGLYFIRRRRFAAHRACMLMMTATAMGAVFFRLYLGLFAMWGGASRWFETFYAAESWAAWMAPRAATAMLASPTLDVAAVMSTWSPARRPPVSTSPP